MFAEKDIELLFLRHVTINAHAGNLHKGFIDTHHQQGGRFHPHLNACGDALHQLMEAIGHTSAKRQFW